MTIFISKDESELEDILSLLNEVNVTGICHSLIGFEATPFRSTSAFEVIFFPSIRSAKYVLDSGQIDFSSYELACNGAQTEKRLLSLGYSSDYVAENAGNPEDVAKDFSSWLGQRKVLVPHSNLSALSVTKFLKEKQYSTIEVYRTLFESIEIEPCDLYVFSSPSNIDSFFKMNTPKAGSKIVVWGNASYNSLEQHGYSADFTLRDGTIDELKLLLQRIFKT